MATPYVHASARRRRLPSRPSGNSSTPKSAASGTPSTNRIDDTMPSAARARPSTTPIRCSAVLTGSAQPETRKIQPTGLRGCRPSIAAPTSTTGR